MKHFLLTVAGVLVGLVLFAIAMPLILLSLVAAAAHPAATPQRTVLDLDLRGGLTDQPPPFSFLGARGQNVMTIIQTLRRAETDDRVKGLLVRLPEAGMAPGAADELRAAFLDFRAHGKPIIAHAQGLYAEGLVTSTYELGAASGDLWLQPSSAFQVTGIANEDLFFKRLFDRYGVIADYQQRYQYKTAVNPFLYDNYTPAHRESELSWMRSVYDTAINDVAADRRRPAAQIESLIEAGPFGADEAKAKGLIDNVGQVRDAETTLLAGAGDGAKLIEFNQYVAQLRARSGLDVGPKVAVISAEGAIVTGTSGGPNPLAGEQTIHSDDLSKAFYDAIDDKNVKAIVFRISSPGGSDTASEQILAAVRAARAAGKPVVVSMGTYGASGGYWIASQANEIIAEPSTLTGSIGVFGGKFVLGPALAKWGVDVHGLSIGGDYAGSSGTGAPMTASQRAAFAAWMDRIYEGFVARVAEGRRLPVARVQQIARGRVWTGAQAKALGLVDQVGGFYLAVERAKALGGLSGAVRLEAFGGGGSAWEALQHMLGADARLAGIAADLESEPELRALIGAADDARLRAKGATVLAPSPFR